MPNPQFAAATLDGATNPIPFFVSPDGPVRVVLFPFRIVNGRKTNDPDGTVHDLFTIRGRTDATNTVGASGKPQTCDLAPDDFVHAEELDDLVFRIPPPLFGTGLIENIPNEEIKRNARASVSLKRSLGIRGRPNMDARGRVMRFGWKAQSASLRDFIGDAYNTEMGVTSEASPIERTNDKNCWFNSTPENRADFYTQGAVGRGDMSNTPKDIDYVSEIPRLVKFVKFLDQPIASKTAPGGKESIARGAANLCAFIAIYATRRCSKPEPPTLRPG